MVSSNKQEVNVELNGSAAFSMEKYGLMADPRQQADYLLHHTMLGLLERFKLIGRVRRAMGEIDSPVKGNQAFVEALGELLQVLASSDMSLLEAELEGLYKRRLAARAMAE